METIAAQPPLKDVSEPQFKHPILKVPKQVVPPKTEDATKWATKLGMLGLHKELMKNVL